MTADAKYIIAIDQGTTSTRTVIFDRQGRIIASAQRALTQHFPEPGWVEHDPMEIWDAVRALLTEVLKSSGIVSGQIAAIGMTNQRETTVVWDKSTGQPVHNAIVWQCRRTAGICEQLKQKGLEQTVRDKTGLVLDAYFSGTKIKWILDHTPGARKRAEQGELLFGTIDTWLLWKMTAGRSHVTDVTNASRTMIFDIHTLDWDETLLTVLDIPHRMLPEVKSSSEIYGHVNIGGKGGTRIPIAGITGDQQAALFGQMCHKKGMAKNTYGTGCFLLMHTGDQPVPSHHGLLTTVACSLNGEVTYALEGSVFMGGASVQWLRDELRLISDAADTEQCANNVSDSGGVYVVPAFTGLGAPYWDPYARGAVVGLSRGSGRDHIVRATLEAIAYQSRDVLDAMQLDSGIILEQLRVDGGASANNFLMQFQSDILNTPVLRPASVETTAAGAAYLAGLAVGFWSSVDDIKAQTSVDKVFTPTMSEQQRAELYHGWQKAVGRSRHWVD